MKSVFTVLGSQGFIGKALSKSLKANGHEVVTPDRHLSLEELTNSLTGHVVYCIGLTADFRLRPSDTVEAHVCLLRHLLENKQYLSFTYLSSTRVYLGAESGSEDALLTIRPYDTEQLYNLSKLMGESLCYSAYRKDRPVRVVRLSNVVGGDLDSGNFVCMILSEAMTKGFVQLHTTLNSAKDYVALQDVTRMLEQIALYGNHRCYNLASGKQITNQELMEAIVAVTGASYTVAENAVHVSYPTIDIRRIASEFGFSPSPPLDYIRKVDVNSNIVKNGMSGYES